MEAVEENPDSITYLYVFLATVCPRSLYPFFMVTYYLKCTRLSGHKVSRNIFLSPASYLAIVQIFRKTLFFIDKINNPGNYIIIFVTMN